jgi:hypothetical protein
MSFIKVFDDIEILVVIEEDNTYKITTEYGDFKYEGNTFLKPIGKKGIEKVKNFFESNEVKYEVKHCDKSIAISLEHPFMDDNIVIVLKREEVSEIEVLQRTIHKLNKVNTELKKLVTKCNKKINDLYPNHNHYLMIDRIDTTINIKISSEQLKNVLHEYFTKTLPNFLKPYYKYDTENNSLRWYLQAARYSKDFENKKSMEDVIELIKIWIRESNSIFNTSGAIVYNSTTNAYVYYNDDSSNFTLWDKFEILTDTTLVTNKHNIEYKYFNIYDKYLYDKDETIIQYIELLEQNNIFYNIRDYTCHSYNDTTLTHQNKIAFVDQRGHHINMSDFL